MLQCLRVTGGAPSREKLGPGWPGPLIERGSCRKRTGCQATATHYHRTGLPPERTVGGKSQTCSASDAVTPKPSHCGVSLSPLRAQAKPSIRVLSTSKETGKVRCDVTRTLVECHARALETAGRADRSSPGGDRQHVTALYRSTSDADVAKRRKSASGGGASSQTRSVWELPSEPPRPSATA